MAKTICILLGVVFLLVGICGFIAPGLLGTHLSLAHNLVHIISGALALYFGLARPSAARKFCLIFGAVYLLLGVLGFIAGGHQGPLSPELAGMQMHDDSFLLKVIPNVLELAKMDHIVHVLLGIVFLIGGFITKADVRAATD